MSLLRLILNTARKRGPGFALAIVALLCSAAALAFTRWRRRAQHERARVALREMDFAPIKGAPMADSGIVARMVAKSRTDAARAALDLANARAESARIAIRAASDTRSADVEEMLRKAGL